MLAWIAYQWHRGDLLNKFFQGTFGFAADDRYDKTKEAQQSDESQLSEEEIKNRRRFTTKSVKFVRHETPQEYDAGKRKDGGPLEKMQVQMETVQKVYTDIKLYRENFQFRERHLDRSNAVKIMLYPRFVVINKHRRQYRAKAPFCIQVPPCVTGRGFSDFRRAFSKQAWGACPGSPRTAPVRGRPL